MNNFEKIPSISGIPGTESKAKNAFGVIVNFSYARELLAYELDGTRYLIQKESGFDGIRYFDTIYPALAYRDGAFGVALPESIIARIREDLPKAYEVMGRQCRIDPAPEKRREFVRAGAARYESEDGIAIYLTPEHLGVWVYECNKVRWLIPMGERESALVDNAFNEADGLPPDKEMRQQIEQDFQGRHIGKWVEARMTMTYEELQRFAKE